MRVLAAALALAAFALPLSPAAAQPSAEATALAEGDWREAATLGASAADVVRALQARGQLAGVVADEAVVSIGPDNRVEVVDLKPLPPLPADAQAPGARTAGLSGSGFTFTARKDTIILYPGDAASAFASPPAGRLAR